MTQPTVSFVTVSYGPDRERCSLLTRSVRFLAPSVEHVIVVDRADRRSFAELEGPMTTVVTTEDVLPSRLVRMNTRAVGLRSNLWLQSAGRPVRGWLIQQIVKLAVTEILGSDIVVHADSDVVLIRTPDPSALTDAHGAVRLYERRGVIDDSLPNHVRWHRNAERLLGLPEADLPLPDFITSLVPWRRENAIALLAHIEKTTGRRWLRAIASASDISEYTLYGRFVTDVLGEAAGQFATSSSLCRDYWTPAALSERELEDFLDDVGDEIGVSLTAKAGMSPEDYVGLIERRWAGADT